jgi:ketosteroid isomerase-like protein
MAHDGVATVERFYDVVLRGDLDSASGLLDENVVVHEPAGLPYGGEFQGIAGWRKVTEHEISLMETELLTPLLFRDVDGETVLLTVKVRFTSRTTGRSAETDAVELLKVRDGRLTVIDVYYRDPGAVAGTGLVARSTGE